MEQVLMPMLVMVGAGLLLMLGVPLGLLAVSGMYFGRRTATRLVPVIRRSAVDCRRSVIVIGGRVVHSRLPQALVMGAAGCALALPSVAAPVRDLDRGWGSGPPSGIAGEPAARVGPFDGLVARAGEEPAANQVRDAPVRTGDETARPVARVDQCVGSCGWTSQQNKSKSKSQGKPKKKKSKL